jgi:hypothetical protein
MDTTEQDRPSLKEVKVKPQRKRVRAPNLAGDHAETSEASQSLEAETLETGHTQDVHAPVEGDTSLYTVQNARSTVQCTECNKPRVIYCKQRLSQRQQLTVTLAISEYDYTCGAPLLPPTCSFAKSILCRLSIGCATPVEVPFYSSSVGRVDLCAYCAMEEAVVDTELKKKFKTVLPLCIRCRNDGKQAIVYRPYGKRR